MVSVDSVSKASPAGVSRIWTFAVWLDLADFGFGMDLRGVCVNPLVCGSQRLSSVGGSPISPLVEARIRKPSGVGLTWSSHGFNEINASNSIFWPTPLDNTGERITLVA